LDDARRQNRIENHRKCGGACGANRDCAQVQCTDAAGVVIGHNHPTRSAEGGNELRVLRNDFRQSNGHRILIAGVAIVQRVGNRCAGGECCAAVGLGDEHVRGGINRDNRRIIGCSRRRIVGNERIKLTRGHRRLIGNGRHARRQVRNRHVECEGNCGALRD